MAFEDLVVALLGLLNITREQMLYALLTAAGLVPVVSWLRPRVEPVLNNWRKAALLTRTTADDNAVKFVAFIWSVLVWVPSAALRFVPVFATPDEVDELQYQRRMSRVLKERK